MQPAFSLAQPGPAPCPGIFARLDGARAVRATDARIIPIMERVVRHAVLVEVAPNLLRSPVGNRIHLHQSEFRVPVDFASSLAEGGDRKSTRLNSSHLGI